MNKRQIITINQLLNDIKGQSSIVGQSHSSCNCPSNIQDFIFTLKYGRVYEFENQTTIFDIEELISVYEKANQIGENGKFTLMSDRYKWEAIFEQGGVSVYKTEF